MKNKINLYWYKHNEGHGNFGDALNPYLIERLSNNEIKHYDINLLNADKFLNFKVLLKSVLYGNISFFQFVDYFLYDYFRNRKVILAIGSILRYKNGKNFYVWGSGIIKADAEFGEAEFLAVRGEYTKNRLKELGYNLPSTLGDPALLLPLVYKPNNKKKYKLGIIPHFVHYNELKHFENSFIKVINLLDPIEKVVDEISMCEKTISTSLHGIIVSHCYNIPSLWFTFDTKNKLFGDDIKFLDYFSSVDLDEYHSIKINFNNFDFRDVLNLFEIYEKFALPKEEKINEVQKGLLECAPFDLKKKYRYHEKN